MVTSVLSMDSKKVLVTLRTSNHYGRYGVIQKVTEKKYKIRFWDTGEETYLMQSSVQVLSGDTDDGRDGKHNPPNGAEGRAKKRTKAKAAKVKVNVNELLQSVGEEDGVTRDEWEAFVDKVGKMFI